MHCLNTQTHLGKLSLACPTLGAGRKCGRAEHGDTQHRRTWRQQGYASLGTDPSPKPVHPVAVENRRLKAVQEGRSLAGHWSKQQHPCCSLTCLGSKTQPSTSLTNTAQWEFSVSGFGAPVLALGLLLRKSEKPRGQQMSQSHQTSLLLNHTSSPLRLLTRTELRECRGFSAAPGPELTLGHWLLDASQVSCVTLARSPPPALSALAEQRGHCSQGLPH